MNKRFRNLSISGLLAAALVLSGAAAYAQQDNSTMQQPASDQAQPMAGMHEGHHGGPEHMSPDQRLAHMTKRYNLTADQQTQIKPILTDEQQQMQALHADTSSSRQDRLSKMQTIHQDAATKISAILNDEQKQKFQQDQARMQQRMQERSQAHGATTEQPQ